ncbi:MAG: hypothetical protein NVSMB67_26180 [Flavisolibacter sp.]
MKKARIEIEYNPERPSNLFTPSESLGAAYDGHSSGDNMRLLSTENIRQMKSVGLKPLSYRLRTELGDEAWHWNSRGRWSEPSALQGYWTSDGTIDNNIQVSYGYFLPRRGNTHDQANDDGYSRIDDKDTTSFWKSNPYLDQFYTGENNRIHPQWVIVDLGYLHKINALKIQWANPYALSYQVDYALDIGKEYVQPFNPDLWHPFVDGSVKNKGDKNKLIRVCQIPKKARFVRILMTESSFTGAINTHDKRDSLGFAIKELQVGLEDESHIFHDWVRHAPTSKHQSIIRVSSTDCWHRARDLDSLTEQAGVDLFFNAGITGGFPAMMPVGLLYDTPENMVALISYLTRKNYQVKEIEMGEEPEGQLVNPADYASLYLQWAKKIINIAPQLKLGGPCFAALAFTPDDPYTFTEKKWAVIFLDYLKKHNGLKYFNFFSTEWYPFDNICAPTAPQLALQPTMISIALEGLRKSILPPGIPIYLTEYGYSAYGGKPEVEIEGALMYADIVGSFLSLGGKKCYLYGYEPAFLDQTRNCGWGNNMLFGINDSGEITYRTAAFYGVQLLTKLWAQPEDSVLELHSGSSNAFGQKGFPFLSTYPIYTPEKKWSLAVINKNPSISYDVSIDIINTKLKSRTSLAAPFMVYQYSGKEYKWLNKGEEGHPVRSLPPEQIQIKKGHSLVLPPYSLTIIRE